MIFFLRIDVDLDKERERIKRIKYTPAQRDALNKLVDLVEKGDWDGVVAHYNDPAAFPYNEKGEYPEHEHISEGISNLIEKLAYHHIYTSDQMLKDAKEELDKLK